METLLKSHGHENGSPADVVIVNTCAVTAESGRKSRQTIRKLADENPNAIIAVSGCYSQLSPQDVSDLGASIVFGTNDKEKFISDIENKYFEINTDNPLQRKQFEFLPAGAVDGRTRAMLKIQDGCVNFCSYCIIPYTRGRLRSLEISKAVEETKRLKQEGFKELVLTGIEIASYGIDLPSKPKLYDIICACAKEAGEMRIRLGSLEPTVVDEEFCKRLAEHKNICRHFHLALQSGCDNTLKAMNRKYDTKLFYEVCERLRRYFPGCAIACDMITGFPGETEEDFENTLSFIKKCNFASMHIFPYSRRPGTVADSMPNQCSNAIKASRAKMAQEVAQEMKSQYLKENIGKVLPVLVESDNKGHSDTYIIVKVSNETQKNEIVNVKIDGIEGDCLYGKSI